MQRASGNGEATEVVEFLPFLGSPKSLAVSGTTASIAFTAGVRRVSMTAYGCDMAIKLGSGAVTAATTDHLLASGERIEVQVRTAETNVAAIAISISGTGTLRITELADA